jgi:hypothetical protein
MKRLRPAIVVALMGLAVAACATPGRPDSELSQEQVCLSHFENDPVERDRCMLDASVRSDTVPDVRPMDLPIRTGQMGD